MTVSFFITGKPVGKGRPRFGNGRTYTPKATADYEKLVRQCYLDAGGRKLSGYVAFEFRALYPIPKSKDRRYVTKKDRELMRAGRILPDAKPDGDNIEKIILDALTGIAFDDDKQVVRCFGWSKMYSDQAGVWVRIGELKDADCNEFQGIVYR